jgi:hypothetical protein
MKDFPQLPLKDQAILLAKLFGVWMLALIIEAL